jgi:hypothetical protein
MFRHYKISGIDPRYRTHVVSHPSGKGDGCPKFGKAGFLLKRKSELSFRNGILLYKQLIRPMMDYA